MAGKTMDVSVLVRLVDRVTGPLGALQRRFAQFAALGQRIGILGAAVAAISFAVPLASAAAFDQQLRDSVVTAGYFGREAEARIAAVGRAYSDLALQVGIVSSALADSGGLLAAAGMDEALIDRLMPTIGRVAKAATAVPTDVAKVAFALSNSLKIGADKMELSLAQLVTAGKLGRFEFRDMAKEIPELAAQFQKFGVTGSEAVATIGASLQVAMFGTDNTSAAANNFKNFLSKLLSPETVKKFKDAGVDIQGVMQKAAAQGINPIEAAIQKITTMTGISAEKVSGIFRANKGKGMTDAEASADAIEQIKKIAGAGKLAGLFGDMQVLDFLLPMLANMEKYKEFKKEIASSGLDVIARDFATQWEGLSTQMTIAEEIGTQALRRIGIGFGRNLPWINAWGTAALGWVQQIDAAFPGAIDQVLSIGGAFLVAVAGLALLVPLMSVLSAAFGVLAVVVGAVLSPLGLVAAAIAGIAYLIYANWGEFEPFFRNAWDGVKDVARGGVQYLRSLFTGDWAGVVAGLRRMASGARAAWGGILATLAGVGRRILNWADQYLGGVPSKVAAIWRGVGIAIGAGAAVIWDAVWPQLRSAAIQILNWARDIPNRVLSAMQNSGSPVLKWAADIGSGVMAKLNSAAGLSDADWTALGTRLGNALVEAVKAAFKGLYSWAAGIPGEIIAAIGSIDLSSIIKWPTMPSFGAPAAGNDNKSGGGGASGSWGDTPVEPKSERHGFAPGGRGGFAPARAVARQEIGGQITVSAAPGSQVESVRSTNSAVPIKADTGRMVGRV